jgi:uncharacterized protein YggE
LLVRLFVASTLAGVIVGSASACDSKAGPVPGNARQVAVVGFGEVQGVPDTLTAEVGIQFVARDITAAMNETSERQHELIFALVDAGVDRKDISTTQVILQPQYGTSDSAGASNTIRVKIAQDSASRTLALIVSTGGDAVRINSVGYSIDEDSQLVQDARARAFDDAKHRADQYAELSGLALGRVISISEIPGDSAPVPTPRSAMAVPVPVEPGQQSVSFSVTAVWELT